jgi:hypothetical protein
MFYSSLWGMAWEIGANIDEVRRPVFLLYRAGVSSLWAKVWSSRGMQIMTKKAMIGITFYGGYIVKIVNVIHLYWIKIIYEYL